MNASRDQAMNLYWLAYLLTGDREVSVDAAVDALDRQEAVNPFFSTWLLAWERKVVISKALAAIRDELAASVRRTAESRGMDLGLTRNRAAIDGIQKIDLERALLSIDVFPRCAVLLRTFEGLSVDDATILLDCSRELLRKAEMIGLCELTRVLAGPSEQALGNASFQGAF